VLRDKLRVLSSWVRISVPAGETPALVGIINRRKDFRILRERHWYRIPVAAAPAGLAQIRFIAFYLTRVFDEERWQVSYYAEVRKIGIARRRELLPDEPAHPRVDENYYRVEIGELQRLPVPIPSRRRRRLVFIPTSLERLFRAKEINELYLTSPIEERLYQALKEAGFQPERQFFVREGRGGYFLDLAIISPGVRVDIECDGERYHQGRTKAAQDRERDNRLVAKGWRIVRFSGREINKNPDECVRLVAQVLKIAGRRRAD
jgi:very-short-patch-repair endonuclease